MDKFNLPTETRSFIAVIGIGGGGCNAVTYMSKQEIVDVEFILINTDLQSLEQSPVKNKILIGENLTQGRGSGSIPSVGRKAALESKDQIESLLSKYSMVFVCAGMGGGTGTGATPVIAEIAMDLGILTIGLVTTPFTFEGQHRRKQGIEGLDWLKMCVDSLIVIPNDYILKEFGSLSISKAFSHSDELLLETIKGIAEMITVPGYVNVDFQDVKTILQNSGICLTGRAIAYGENRATVAVKNALNSASFDNLQINKIDKMLLSISSGLDEELQMDELVAITDVIHEFAGDNAEVIFGHGVDQKLKNRIRVTIVCVLGNQNFIQDYEERESLKIGVTPHYLQPFTKRLKSDYPKQTIAFIIMQFKNTPVHKNIFDIIKIELEKYGIKALRADQKIYSDDLFTNILTYMHTAKFGIALYDRITEDEFNPNVSLEVGYMLGLEKNVCILKDSSLKTLHSDLAGRIYQPIDIFNLEESLPSVLNKWLLDKELI